MLRRAAILVFAFVLALTAQALAVARGQPAVAGEMVICAGGLVQTVSVDAEGNPVGPRHYCPDCALSLLAAASPAPYAEPAPAFTSFATLRPVSARTVHAATPLKRPPARGPPVRV